MTSLEHFYCCSLLSEWALVFNIVRLILVKANSAGMQASVVPYNKPPRLAGSVPDGDVKSKDMIGMTSYMSRRYIVCF